MGNDYVMNPILVVDDELDILEIMQDILEDYMVETVPNVGEAMARLNKHPYDLVITDIKMPGESGLDLLRYVKEKKINTLVTIMTGHGDKSLAVECLKAGAFDFFDKPCDEEEILHCVRRAMEKHKYEREHLRLLKEVQEKNQELEALNENLKKSAENIKSTLDEKHHLLRILCHDLNNALSLMQTSYRLGHKIALSNPEQSLRFWANIDKGCNTQKEIIQLVTEMEALSSGKKELELKPVEVRDIFEKGKFIFKFKLEEKSINLNYTSNTEEPIHVNADPVSFSNNVFNNLISNAIKFTPAGGTITTQVSKLPNGIEIRVIDQGIGIPEKILKNIFRPDKQTTREGTNKEKGTGFGMPLVKTYMDLYKATINIVSTTKEDSPDNYGTQIILFFPN